MVYKKFKFFGPLARVEATGKVAVEGEMKGSHSRTV